MANEETVNTAELLKRASVIPQGMKTTEYNPTENLPTLGVGTDIVPGSVLAGFFEGTETITSPKFKKTVKKSAEGIPQQDLHVLRLTSGEKLGIWSVAALQLFFSKRTPGEFVVVKYTGKGINESGNSQHFFEFEIGQSSLV